MTRLLLVTLLVVFAQSASGLTTSTAELKASRARGAKPCNIEQQARPFVLVSRERLEELRKTLLSPGWHGDLYRSTCRLNADTWLTRTIVIPKRAGHFHQYVCTDGTKLELPTDQQFKTSNGPYQCPACGRLYTGERFDGGRRNMEHRWLMSACRDMAFVYALEGEKRYAEKAAEVLVKYADAYPGRHTAITTGGIFYQSLEEAVKFIVLAQAYDLIHDAGVLTDEQKQHVESDLFWEAAEGLMKMGLGGNWGSWHLAGIGCIGYATKHQRFIDYALKSFKSQMSEQLGEDGIWPESVHTYHFYPFQAFLHLAEAAANSGNDLYAWQAGPKRNLKAMFVEPLQYMYPNFQLPAINDGWYHCYMYTDLYDVGYDRYRLPELGWLVNELRRGQVDKLIGSPDPEVIWTLVHGRDIPADARRPVFKSTNFPVLGICTLRNEKSDMMATFDYGKFLGHGQLDKMGFTLFANGKVLVPDLGTPSYGSAIMPYYTGTFGHNTVMVDQRDQERTTTHSLDLGVDGSTQVASSETKEAYPGVTWRRTIWFAENDIMMIDDALESKEEHTYDWLMRGMCEKVTCNDLSPAEDDTSSVSGYLQDIRKFSPKMTTRTETRVRVGQVEADYLARARWLGPGEKPEMEMLAYVPEGAVVITGTCPGVTAAKRIPMVILRSRGKSAHFRVNVRAFRSQ